MTLLPMPFANPATYAGHSGIDYPGHTGATILASGPGKVSHIGSNDRGGHYIWVKYNAIAPLVGYHHMNSFNGCPPAGALIQEGSRLGYVGWDGHVVPPGPGGAHLHSEVAGYATTSGYWKFFDRNRVVGQGSGGGTTPTPGDEDMPMTEADAQLFWSYLLGNAQGVRGRAADWLTNMAGQVGSMPTSVWNEKSQAMDANGNLIPDKFFRARDYLVSTNAQVGQGITDAQIKAITDAVIKGIGTPTVSVDYAKIAHDVREVFRADPLK